MYNTLDEELKRMELLDWFERTQKTLFLKEENDMEAKNMNVDFRVQFYFMRMLFSKFCDSEVSHKAF